MHTTLPEPLSHAPISTSPVSSRQWFRDWSAWWMADAQACAVSCRKLKAAGWDAGIYEPFRRMAITSLRRSLRAYKASLDAPDAPDAPREPRELDAPGAKDLRA